MNTFEQEHLRGNPYGLSWTKNSLILADFDFYTIAAEVMVRLAKLLDGSTTPTGELLSARLAFFVPSKVAAHL